MRAAEAVLLALVVGGIVLGPSVVCWLKGKRWWAVLGFPTLWHWVPVFRLAKPDSWWARRYYDQDKLLRAQQRFGDDPFAGPSVPTEAVDAFSEDDILLQDKTTRRAWKKAQKQLGA
jgi:hypothetical protein